MYFHSDISFITFHLAFDGDCDPFRAPGKESVFGYTLSFGLEGYICKCNHSVCKYVANHPNRGHGFQEYFCHPFYQHTEHHNANTHSGWEMVLWYDTSVKYQPSVYASSTWEIRVIYSLVKLNFFSIPFPSF